MGKAENQEILSQREAIRAALEIAPGEDHRLLFYAPRDYLDCSRVVDQFNVLSGIELGTRLCVIGRMHGVRYFAKDKKPTSLFAEDRKPVRCDIQIKDAQGVTFDLTMFGNVWQMKDVLVGETLLFSGVMGEFRGMAKFERAQLIPLTHAGKVIPIYPAIRGKVDAASVFEALETWVKTPGVVDRASIALLESLQMDEAQFKAVTGITPKLMLSEMHAPRSVRHGLACLDRAVKVSATSVYLKSIREPEHVKAVNARIPLTREVVRQTLADANRFFQFTPDQKAAIIDSLKDLTDSTPMRRLLTGDVGTGKTITFLVPSIAAHRSGAQCAILAPNELVVNQIVSEINRLAEDVTTQAVSAKTKKLVPGALLVGTTALLSRIEKAALKIDMLVVDEQHKFSRDQRERLISDTTNYIEATATAIPRTMALVTHAGMKSSQLHSRPFERHVDTRIMLGRENQRVLLERVTLAISRGDQVAIVYPAVEQREKMIDVDTAVQKWEKLLPNEVVRLHGKMSATEKNEAIALFRANEKKVLVCSTVIEVGVSLPSLREIIIINPERYGMAQIHQLRGRVARLGGEGFCTLYCPNPIDEASLDRLKMIAENDNGFVLAEKDLERRGFGDLDISSEVQTGKTMGVFFNIEVNPADLERASSVHCDRVLNSQNKSDKVMKVKIM